MELFLDWTEFKTLYIAKKIPMQYITNAGFYKIFMQEGIVLYRTDIFLTSPASTDQTDFETNYQSTCNASNQPRDIDGKIFTRSESRPLNMTTYFTMAGDHIANGTIGDGKILTWDFSNSDDIITAPSGFKRKRIEFQFLDAVHVKEGTIYWKDKLYGSYIDLMVVCPNGQYYLNNAKSPVLAEEDTVVEHFVNHHRMFDTCAIGDELNAESASSSIPSSYKFWIEITVPDTDTSSKGNSSVEFYRTRTVIL